MRRMLPFLTLAVLMGASAFARQPEPSRPNTKVYRSGAGAPRERNATAARTYSPSTLGAAGSKAPSRPYQVPRPGEGAPKGN